MTGFVEAHIPSASALEPLMIETAWFCESYHAPLNQPGQSVTDLFEAVLGHHPRWIKAALILRNRVAGRAGLAVAPDDAIRSFERKPCYAVGDTIGPWPIYHLSETELIAGRDNSHLDFRFSILKLGSPVPSAAFSTVCSAHNIFGKIYLFLIIPFHRWGMRHLIRRAIAAGRL